MGKIEGHAPLGGVPALRAGPWTARSLRDALAETLLADGIDLPREFWVRRRKSGAPGRAGCQDRYVSNLGLLLAGTGRKPAELARVIEGLGVWPGVLQEAKGFLNFAFNDEMLADEVARAVHEGERFGAGDSLAGVRILVEFVSADPTGPLPFSFGRIAAAGDALCRILAFQGADVTREFYLNDVESSAKMRLLGESVSAAYGRRFGHDLGLPEGVLSDGFIDGIASAIAEREGNAYLLVPEAERNAHFATEAKVAAIAAQRATLKSFGVRFDVWTSEAALRREGRVEATLGKLAERGHTYLRGGATWLRTAQFGDEADRVLVRQNGEQTYLASDIAYHTFKFERGFDLVINIWTAEHRQYFERTRAALTAVGIDASRLEVMACEGARWIVDGKPAARGRAGGVFTLDEAIADVPSETLRFWFLRSGWDSPESIDIERAALESETNPAYAARLLPARLATMIKEAGALSSETGSATNSAQWSEADRTLAHLVALWPDTALTAATERAPHQVAEYVSELAAATKSVLGASRPGNGVALDVLRAASVAARAALRLLGIEPRERF